MENESYSIFFADNGIDKKYYLDDNTNVNTLVQRLADGNLTYPDIGKNCTVISEWDFAEREQSKNNPPVFCAEINLCTKNIIGDDKPMELTVWDNDKIATINLDEAIRSIKENGTVNLDYKIFAENNDELSSEYLDLSQDFIETVQKMSDWSDKVQEKALMDKNVQRNGSNISI